MKTKSVILISAIVLIALPSLWSLMKIFGVNPELLNNFWRHFWPWAIGFIMIIGGYITIIKLKKR